jgi:FixJ family two-component response regulator
MEIPVTKTLATFGIINRHRNIAVCAAGDAGMNCFHYELDSELELAVRQVQVLLMPLQRDTQQMLKIQRELRVKLNPLCIIYISDRADLQSVVRAVQLGAICVLPFDLHDNELVDALQVSSRIYDQRALWINQYLSAKQSLDSLTPRQKDIVRLVVAGCTNKATAIKLQISEKTIEKHRQTIQERMHTTSLPELTAKFLLAQEFPDIAYGWRMTGVGDAVGGAANSAPDNTKGHTALSRFDQGSLVSPFCQTSLGAS